MKAMQPQGISPENVYPLAAFREIAGLSETRIRLARREGLDLTTFAIGRRKFVRGADGIEFMRRLSRQPSAN